MAPDCSEWFLPQNFKLKYSDSIHICSFRKSFMNSAVIFFLQFLTVLLKKYFPNGGMMKTHRPSLMEAIIISMQMRPRWIDRKREREQDGERERGMDDGSRKQGSLMSWHYYPLGKTMLIQTCIIHVMFIHSCLWCELLLCFSGNMQHFGRGARHLFSPPCTPGGKEKKGYGSGSFVPTRD